MRRTRHFWWNTGLFLVFGMVSIGVPMIPLGLSAGSLPFPDLLFAFMIAWIIRQPETAPLISVVFLALLGDALLMRPLGLWALMLLAGTELVRWRQRAFGEAPFLLEWVSVAVLFVVLLVMQNFLLLVSFAHMHGFTTLAGHAVRTIAIYPLVVAGLHWGLHIRVPRPSMRPNRVGVVL